MEELHWNEDGTHTHCCTCGHSECPRMKFIIPVGAISDYNPKWWMFWHWGKKKVSAKEKVQKSLAEMMALYKEDLVWDETTGEVSINGAKQMPFTKQMWFPDNGCTCSQSIDWHIMH